MPLFNHEDYVGSAIASIEKQTYKNWELIIIDDGSTDGSGAVARAQAQQNKKIHYVFQKNQGEAMARNHGMKLARGQYIVWQDADDFSHPKRLATMVDFLTTHPRVGAVASCYNETDHSGKVITWRSDFAYPPERLPDETGYRGLDLIYNYVLGGTMMLRHSAQKKIGWFRPLAFGTDKDFLLRLEEQYQVVILPQHLYNCRRHGDNSLIRMGRDQQGKKKSRRLPMALGNLNYLLSAYTRRIYGVDPLARVPYGTPLARVRYLLYFLPYFKIYRFLPRILRLNKMSLPELFLRLIFSGLAQLAQESRLPRPPLASGLQKPKAKIIMKPQ